MSLIQPPSPDRSANLAGFNPDLPLEKASTVPSRWYFDGDIYALERKSIFRSSWQAVGRLEQLALPGSYLTAELAGEPIVVTRDKSGALNAFSNVCRHRAAKVATEAAGTAEYFRCHYHGWTYDLCGQLKGAPEFNGVCDFLREENNLPKWRVAFWGPLVFVCGEAAAPDLEEFLAPFPSQVAGLGIEKLKFVHRQEYRLECNWKVFVDNYLDGGYHVNTIHPSLAGVLDYNEYRTEIHSHSSVQSSPLKAASGDQNQDIARVRSGSQAYYWWLFPNLMLNIYDGVMDTNLVLPVSPTQCRVVFDYYFADTGTPAAREYMDRSMAVAHQIQVEDLGICEEVQRGLVSCTYDTGRFSVRREKAGHYFHQLLARRLFTGA